MLTGMNFKVYLVVRKKCKCITFFCKTDDWGKFWPWFRLPQEKLGLFNEYAEGFNGTYHRW